MMASADALLLCNWFETDFSYVFVVLKNGSIQVVGESRAFLFLEKY